jgi:hypothetical protein
MAVFSVDKGKHDFTPNWFPLPYFNRTISRKVILHENCWFSLEDEDYNGGNDVKDWNKIFGLTSYTLSNTDYSMIFAWRPAAEKNTFEITAYVNPKDGGKFETGTPIIVKAGEQVVLTIKWGVNAVFSVYGNEAFKYRGRRPWVVRKIGPWFGGNQTAHKDMSLEIIRL